MSILLSGILPRARLRRRPIPDRDIPFAVVPAQFYITSLLHLVSVCAESSNDVQRQVRVVQGQICLFGIGDKN